MKVGCIGELVIDFICPEPATSVAAASRFVKCPGGSPANVAAMLHEAGIDVTLVSRVGRDAFGTYLLDVVTTCGLSTHAISKDPRYPTRCVFMAHDSAGRRSVEIANRNSADQYMEEMQVAAEVLGTLDWLHVGGTTLLGAQTGELMLALVDRVKQHQGTISFDPNINLQRISGAAVSRLHRLLPFVDLLKVNEDEWRVMQENFQVTPGTIDVIVCTQGKAGARVIAGEAVVDVAAEHVVVTDVTGAGDAFFAGFLSYLIKHKDANADFNAQQLRQAAEAGNQHAGSIIQAFGGALAQNA